MPRKIRKSISSFFKSTKPSPEELAPPLPPIIAQTQRLSIIEEAPKPAKAEPKPPRAVQLITPENLRELRETIRLKYALDIEIWRQRDVKFFSRDKLKENIRKSEAALEKIRKTVADWDRREYFSTDLEHEKFREIKRRLMEGEKADWTQKPPWEFVHHAGNPYEGPWETDGQPVNFAEKLTYQMQRQAAEPQGPNAVPRRPVSGTPGCFGGPPRPMNNAPRPMHEAQRFSRGPPLQRPEGAHTRDMNGTSPYGPPVNNIPMGNTPTYGTPQHSAPTSSITLNGTPTNGTPLNGTPRSFSAGQRPSFADQRPADPYRHKYRLSVPIGDRHTATGALDGNGIVPGGTEPNTRSRRSTLDTQRRVTDLQWQDLPVEYNKEGDDERTARLRLDG